ncbi:MAG: hypothetical protein IT427_05855, partial [Pirellulales bacterium]|nr:hypothetical protein [Pirellulales bacterium]
MNHSRMCTTGLLALGVIIGIAAQTWLLSLQRSALAQSTKPASDLQSQAAELETIQGKLPDQSHAMQDVGYHFSNLWFAAQHKNWSLANFYWSETRSHLRWAVRIIPKRKDSAGREIDLQGILQALENGPIQQLQDSVEAKDLVTVHGLKLPMRHFRGFGTVGPWTGRIDAFERKIARSW